MKLPLKAPQYRKLLLEIDSKRMMDILNICSEHIPNKYLHWDQLRHRNPPDGISHQEWWVAIKFERRPNNDITFMDKNQNSFNFSTVEPIPEILHEIDLNAGGGLLMQDDHISSEMRDQYIVRSLIEEAITSSQLEGASTTKVVAKELIRTGRKPIDRHEKMILNNFNTMKSIIKFCKEPLTNELVFRIHELITRGTLDDPSAAGRFRRNDEEINVYDKRDNTLLHVPPDSSELEDRMKKMCDFANGKDESGFIHPVIRSIILHFWLAYDHPFCDGNGRTARALFYWSMLRHKYWLFEFVSISEIILKGPAKYARAFLYTETDDNDLTYFIIYHLDILRRSINRLSEYIERRTRQLKKVESNLKSVSILNHRQRALVSHALNHLNTIYTVKGHQTSHNVTYQTARTDLLGLEDMGLFSSSKFRKTWHFEPVPDLEEKLANLN